MVIEAIKAIGKRNGSSSRAIATYIKNNYPVSSHRVGSFNFYVRDALGKAVDDGLLSVNKLTYKLVASAPKDKKKKSTTKKSTSTKKSTATTSSTSTKRKRSSSPASTTTTAAPKKKRSSSTESSTTKRKSSTTTTPKRSAPKITFTFDSTTSEKAAPSPVTKPTGLKGDHVWQYFDGHWKNYDTVAANVVEDVYQKYLANRGDTDVRAVKSGSWEYQVDFMAMKQTNIQHENHTVRNIRRQPIGST